jgi:hypothetical protein
MKILSLIAVLSILMLVTSCKKDNQSGSSNSSQNVERNIRFTLYTDKDFSNDDAHILFSVFIESSSNQPIWDSALAPMKIKEIPAFANKIVVDKTITGYGNKLLKIGFRYTIDGVGSSSHYDAFSPAENFKEIEFNFQ